MHDLAHGGGSCRERCYANSGNLPLLQLVDHDAKEVLDVGCGSGDNARLLKTLVPRVRVEGITASPLEHHRASECMDSCHVLDIEAEWPAALQTRRYDVIICSHVLEHLRCPAEIVLRLSKLLPGRGQMLVAVPNILFWRQRLRFLAGLFEYTDSGIMDATHLRFFTHRTAARYLVQDSSRLSVETKCVTGSVPLWVARRHLLPASVSELLDRGACRLFPNVFGRQVILSMRKR